MAGLSATSVEGAAGLPYPLIFMPFISSGSGRDDPEEGPCRFPATRDAVLEFLAELAAEPLLADAEGQDLGTVSQPFYAS